MDFVMDAYCGIYCGACPNLLATRAGTGTNPCHGCKSKAPTGYCATCGIKTCATQKGFEFCCECPEFVSCERMQQFMNDKNWPYQQNAAKNMEWIQLNGISSWLQVQEQRWLCANCGSSYSWWTETCPQCGQAVASYKADL